MAAQTPPTVRVDTAALLDIRDDVAVARDFVACIFMACQFGARSSERGALSAVSNAAREQLEAIACTLDEIIAHDKSGLPKR